MSAWRSPPWQVVVAHPHGRLGQAVVLLRALARLLLRARAQWHDLLAALEIDVPLRSQVFAFLVGEVWFAWPPIPALLTKP